MSFFRKSYSSALVDDIEKKRKKIREVAAEIDKLLPPGVEYKIGMTEGRIEVGDTIFNFSGSNCFVVAEALLSGIAAGAKEAQRRGTPTCNSRYKQTPENMWDPINKDMAREAVVKMTSITTESLHLIMRECFIMGVKKERGEK